MKKITLIACAALVAGLLVSCNNGAKDYNEVTTTSTEYEYLVTGTIEVETDHTEKTFDKDNKQTNGSSYNYTETYTIESTPGFVNFGTNEAWSGNYDGYNLKAVGLTGYYEKKGNSGTYWDGTKEKDYTAAELKSRYEVEKTDDPINLNGYPAYFDSEFYVYLYKIDGEYKVASNGALFDATVDEDAIEAGEDFTVSYTIVNDDSSNSSTYTDYDADGKPVTTAASNTRTNTSTNKVTRTYTLKFSAK